MSASKLPVVVFRLGQLVSTPNALRQLQQPDILTALQRHQAGDWGDVDDHDRQANDQALTDGTRLLSVYHTAAGIKFWIITEADRSVSTVLMQENY